MMFRTWVFFGALLLLSAATARPASIAAGNSGSAERAASWDESGRIFVWDGSGALQAGWPVAASGAWPAGTPRFQDLDGDGQPELVCMMRSWTHGCTVRAWRLDGQPFPGYEGLPCPGGMSDTPLLGHVLSAGSLDWVWPTAAGEVSISPVGDPSHPRPGFPVLIGPGRLRLRVADVDGDGVDEVLGGLDAGASGRWFVLRMRDVDEPVQFYQLTPSGVTAPPTPAQLAGDPMPELMLTMRDRLECRTPDGAGGYTLLPGWPVVPAVCAGGDAAVLGPWPNPSVVARSQSGGLAAYMVQGPVLQSWMSGLCLGPPVDQADFPSAARGTHWVAHAGGNALRFEADAGRDSAGRPRLYTLELGDRHHTVYSSAPAGLLPRLRCHLAANGQALPEWGPPLHLSQADVRLSCSLDDPALSGNPDLHLVVRNAQGVKGRVSGKGALELRLELESGAYQAVVLMDRDTLAAAAFQVEAPLALGQVFSYPNPMKQQTDFWFDLSRPAKVSVDIFTVAGRKIRRLQSESPQGRQRLGWDGRDAWGTPAANGVYLYRVAAAAGSERAETMGKLIRLN